MTRASDLFNEDGTRKDQDCPWRDCPAVEAFETAVQARLKQYVAEARVSNRGVTRRMMRDLSLLARTVVYGPKVDRLCMSEYLGFMLTAALVEGFFLEKTVDQHNRIVPLANKGAKFSTGGKKRAGSVRRAIRRVLKSKPHASAAVVWAELKRKPPKGMTFCDSEQFEPYIWKDGEPETKYPRFRNIVSEEKKALLASK